MTDFISGFGLSPVSWLLIFMAGAFIGANKTGVVGISLISIPILAAVFGGKASTGVLLPMLIAADVIAIVSFRKSIRWNELLGILPWTLAGIGIALFVGDLIADSVFKICIASVVFLVLIFMITREFRGQLSSLKPHWYLNAAVGLLGGFSSMIGNAAGPVIAVYFLSRNLDKNEFIATRAWFFWIINLLKVPLHIFVWKTITFESLSFNLMMTPAIVIGAFTGFYLVKKIPEKPYRIFLICITAVSSLFLII